MIRLVRRCQTRLAAKFSTFNEEEVTKFSQVKDWWDPYGSQKGLHAYNPLRVDFVKKNVYSYGSPNPGFMFLKDKRILDVGSGPGIFAEVCPLLSIVYRQVRWKSHWNRAFPEHIENSSRAQKA